MRKYAFPNDLLEAIKARWNTTPASQEFQLPEDGILRRLLETCYHASIRTVEQRPVHCVLAYAPKNALPSDALLLFEHPVELTDDQLVRLAPVADVRRTLIGCDGGDGSPQIWGLFEHGHAWTRYLSGDPPDAPVREADLPPDCLTVSIEEPGGLSVSRGRRGLVRLREGRILIPQQSPLQKMEGPLGRFFGEMVDALGADGGDNSESPAMPSMPSLLQTYTTTLAAILDRIRSRKQGGSIIVTRTPIDESLAQITYTVGAHVGLAARIVSYYEARCGVIRVPADDAAAHPAHAALRQASQQLLRGLNQISLLATVDGAVLLDGDLQIEGFGVRFPVLLSPGATIVDAGTGIELPCDRWGLRHQSVFSVCQKCEQSVGLIVSQDGAVKAVKSVSGRLHYWEGILD